MTRAGGFTARPAALCGRFSRCFYADFTRFLRGFTPFLRELLDNIAVFVYNQQDLFL
jgi:hypothetical protein